MGQTPAVISEEILVTASAEELYRMLVQNQAQLIAFQTAQLEYQKATDEKLEAIRDILSQAKGGWKVFIWTGTALSGFVAALGWFFSHFKIPPFH